MVSIDFGGFVSGVRSNFKKLYRSRIFPFYFLMGGVVMDAFANDIIWLLIGIGGFIVFTVFKVNER